MGLICVVCLAFFLHFRQVRIEVLELNTTASRYVVAQVDFEFPDYETTIIMKTQATQDVGSIYQVDPQRIRDVRFDLNTKFSHTKEWRSLLPKSTFKELHHAIEVISNLLTKARFTDVRTMDILKALPQMDFSYYEFIPEKDNTVLPEEIWDQLKEEAKKEGEIRPETIDFCINHFQVRSWELKEDDRLERTVRNQLGNAVPDQVTRMEAGSHLIKPGERVTSRHLTQMKAMKQAIADSRNLEEPLPVIGDILLAIIFVVISGLYFHISSPTFLRSLQQLSLFICIILLTLLFAKLTELALLQSDSVFFSRIRYPIVAPFATILICVLLSSRIALFAAAFLSIILSVNLAVDHSRFLILNLIASIVVIIFTRNNLRKRKEVFSICLKAFFAALLVLVVFSLSENVFWSSSLCIDIGSALFFLMATAILVVGLLPALETIFHCLTDMMLMEYMDPTNELLQKMAMTIPGTYQHSLVLGTLSEAAALSIKANGLFCRVATLYHDIGKMLNPEFYTENQHDTINVHHLLTPIESAQVIISHVTDGEKLARKYHLPQPFIDIIRQHHGTTLVYYFYRKQLDLDPGRADPALFRYPGPKPQTKESAIIMVADTVEAASRSLDDVSEEGLSEMVERLVTEKTEDGQLDECNLTFEELTQVKRNLVKSLLMAHHIRIKYPRKDK